MHRVDIPVNNNTIFKLLKQRSKQYDKYDHNRCMIQIKFYRNLNKFLDGFLLFSLHIKCAFVTKQILFLFRY